MLAILFGVVLTSIIVGAMISFGIYKYKNLMKQRAHARKKEEEGKSKGKQKEKEKEKEKEKNEGKV